MPVLSRSAATLRVTGDNLAPEEITALLGSEPTHFHLKGDTDVLSSGAVRVRKTGMWSLSASDANPANFDAQVAEILDRLTDDLPTWRVLNSRYETDLSCGWFLAEGNEGLEISPETMGDLAARGIKVDLDIYGP